MTFWDLPDINIIHSKYLYCITDWVFSIGLKNTMTIEIINNRNNMNILINVNTFNSNILNYFFF